jgi:M6 family metalloprotease-like protein
MRTSNRVRRLVSFMLSLSLVSMGLIVPIKGTYALRSGVATVSAEESTTVTMDSLPTEYQESMDWVWQNRILDEQSTSRWNLIFDQIVAGDGTLNYVVKWQSSTALTYEQRQKFQSMLERQVNAWTDWLVDFEGWPYEHVNVDVVGWAVSDESLILDRHDDEVVYTTCTVDELHSSNSAIPEALPYAPSEDSRAEHYYDSDYEYPGTRFDMYLWGTTSFEGGAGGDWGQRVSDEYILQNLDAQDAHIIEHEIGHGFGLTDFYDEDKTPTWPEGTTNIMVSGWATEVTDYDGWMLRYVWDKIKDESQDGVARFNLPASGSTTDTDTTTDPTTDVGTDTDGDTAQEPLLGDLDRDGRLSALDVAILKKHLLNVSPVTDEEVLDLADLDRSGSIDVVDLCTLKNLVLYPRVDGSTTGGDVVPDGGDEPDTTTPTTPDPEPDGGSDGTTDGGDVDESDFITAPILQLAGSLPSQGDANLVVFYVDFPDCTYSDLLSTDELQELAFGSADESSDNYPFESMSAFFERSSKGSMSLDGQVFYYTAQHSIEYYNDNKVALAEECFDAFDATVDFSVFDGDGDGVVDATLFNVPSQADDTYWWACSGAFGDDSYTVDGVSVGNIITGNVSTDDRKEFNSSYLHEMGHCFGLPDYYLYGSTDDFDSMKGGAGTELMDADAYSDFSAFSKLMLGWYREDQVLVYDSTQGTQTFTLNSAQTDAGNCLIIPYGELDGSYFSEYFIVEYSTDTGNNGAINSDMGWWQSCDSGIRVHHIKADQYDNGWWTYLKYENGSEFTTYGDDDYRVIRLVNEGNGCFKSGDTVDSSTSGFAWYDSNGQETVDPNVTISIGELSGGSYTVTVSNAN